MFIQTQENQHTDDRRRVTATKYWKSDQMKILKANYIAKAQAVTTAQPESQRWKRSLQWRLWSVHCPAPPRFCQVASCFSQTGCVHGLENGNPRHGLLEAGPDPSIFEKERYQIRLQRWYYEVAPLAEFLSCSSIDCLCAPLNVSPTGEHYCQSQSDSNQFAPQTDGVKSIVIISWKRMLVRSRKLNEFGVWEWLFPHSEC